MPGGAALAASDGLAAILLLCSIVPELVEFLVDRFPLLNQERDGFLA
jgi:hypothetical protein